MSQFYGSVQGQAKTAATRRGGKASGIRAHIRGWNVGAEVACWHDKAAGVDVVQVFKTGGSNGGANKVLVAEFRYPEHRKDA